MNSKFASLFEVHGVIADALKKKGILR